MGGGRRRNGARINATAAPSPPRRIEPVSVPVNGLPPALLSLSDRELEIVMAQARPLAPAARSEFLAAIALRVAGRGEVGEGLLSRICRELLPRYFEPPDTAAVARWGRERAVKSADAQARWREQLPDD
jgi:hypothetical protein